MACQNEWAAMSLWSCSLEISLSEGEQLADRLNQSLRKPYYADNNSIFVAASIGVCEYSHHGSSGETQILPCITPSAMAETNIASMPTR
ncbi:hypothetical protein OK016_21730 [Vibrio chagasii]|nr:hypothetical protein [Vibrio chagasii]